MPTSAIVDGSGVADKSPPDGRPPPVPDPPPSDPPDPPGAGDPPPPKSGSGVLSSPSPLPGSVGSAGPAGSPGAGSLVGGVPPVASPPFGVDPLLPVPGSLVAPPTSEPDGALDGVGDGAGDGLGVGAGDGAGDGFGAGATAAAAFSTRAVVLAGVSAVPPPRANGLIACQRPPSAAAPLDADDHVLRRREPLTPHGVQRFAGSVLRSTGSVAMGADAAAREVSRGSALTK